jgi:hypothetical protein
MKLPSVQYTQGVKPLGVAPSGAEAILAESQTEATAFNEFSRIAANISEGISESQGDERFADASLTLQNSYSEAMAMPNALDAPTAFKTNSDAIKAAAKEEMDGIAYKKFEQKFDAQSDGMHKKLIVDSTFRANKEQRKSMSSKAMELSRSGQLKVAVGLIESSILFSDTEKDEMYNEMGRQEALGSIENTVYSNNPDLISGELDNLKSSKYSGPLQGRERSSAISSLESAYKDSVAALQEAVAHERGKILGDLKVAIENGKAGPMEIEEAYDNYREFITPAKREQFLSLANRLSNERNDKMMRKINVRQALALGEPLDPGTPDHVKGVNEIFSDDPTIANGTDLAIKTNIMPELMKSEFRRQAIAGKPERVLELANSFEVIQRENPIAVDDFGSKQIAIYTTVATLNRGGVPLAEAVDVARTNAAKSPEERQQYRLNLKTEENTSTDRLRAMMDASEMDVSIGFGGAPDATPAMQAAYAAAEAEYYTLMGGNIEYAQEAAFKHLLRVYSVSEINGTTGIGPFKAGKPMAYAPERVTGLPIEYLRKDLNKLVKKIDPKIVPKEAFIISDAQTARERGVKSYPVYRLNKFRLPEPMVNEEGEFVRWTPKVNKYKEFMKTQRGKALEKEKIGINTPGKEQQFLFGGR